MSAHLFVFEWPTTYRTNERPEAAALAEVLKALRHRSGDGQRVEAQRKRRLADLAMLTGGRLR